MTNDLFLSEKYHQAEIIGAKALSDYILSLVHQVRTLPPEVINTWCCKRKEKKRKHSARILWCWKAIIGRKATQGCADSAMTDSNREKILKSSSGPICWGGRGDECWTQGFSLAQLVWKPLGLTGSISCSLFSVNTAPHQAMMLGRASPAFRWSSSLKHYWFLL